MENLVKEARKFRNEMLTCGVMCWAVTLIAPIFISGFFQPMIVIAGIVFLILYIRTNLQIKKYLKHKKHG